MRYLQPDDGDYPQILRRYRYARSLPTISVIGNLNLLQTKTLAFFCLVKCPSSLNLQTYNLALTLHNTGITVISGFHSPVERKCLSQFLQGTQPVILCPARGLEEIRLPTESKQAIIKDWLLLLKRRKQRIHRASTNLARMRNRFVAALAETIFITHVATSSKTEALARQILAWNKPLLTLDDPENSNLIT